MIYIIRLPLLAILASIFLFCNPQKVEKAMESPDNVILEEMLFGLTPRGDSVRWFHFRNMAGVEVRVIDYGGIITHIFAPDKEGNMADIAMGFDSLAPYLAGHPYFGAIIGRYGNRIAKGSFTLDGETYQLAVNNMGNHLHGGLEGFDKVRWNAEALPGAPPSLRLTYRSPDGEEGYPGNLDVEVRYTLYPNNELHVEYLARTDRTTIVNLTNHSYFNLSGRFDRDILDHELSLEASRFVVVDSTLIPTGELRAAQGTPFDFRSPRAIGERIDADDEQLRLGGGYDHCFALDGPADSLRLAARLYHPESGRQLELFTTEPGLQLYSGNFLNGTLKGKGGARYDYRHALCLEPQHFPDSPNRAEFPSVVLRPGEVYRSKTVYRFGAR
jgi:aldose 1-epimerase